ncbi:MAG: type II CAAX endopeptidase family protein [Anaerovoracaceae bacterium]
MKEGIVNRITIGLFVGSMAVLGITWSLNKVVAQQYTMYLNVLLMFLILPIAWLVIKKIPATNIETHKISISEMVCWFIICMMGLMAFNLLGHGVSVGVSKLFGHSKPPSVVASFVNEIPIWFNLLAVVIIGPIVEELLFRKIILKRLLPYGKKAAIIVSAILFGIYHMNLEQLFYTTFMGLVLGVIMVKTGHIIYPIIIHMIANFWGGTMPMIFADKLTILGFCNLMFLVVGLIIVIFKGKSLVKSKNDIYHTLKLTPKKLFVNWGMLFFFGYWLVSNYRLYK